MDFFDFILLSFFSLRLTGLASLAKTEYAASDRLASTSAHAHRGGAPTGLRFIAVMNIHYDTERKSSASRAAGGGLVSASRLSPTSAPILRRSAGRDAAAWSFTSRSYFGMIPILGVVIDSMHDSDIRYLRASYADA